MGKRSRMLRSSSFGAASPLDKIFCRDPADAWVESSAPTPPPSPPPANPVETDLEVADTPPPTPKTRTASPRASLTSEAGEEAPEGSPTSPVIFSVEASCRGPSTEDFAQEKPGEWFRSCFSCKKLLDAKEPMYMFGYMRAFCSPFCRAKQMKKEGIVLTMSTKASKVNPPYVDKKSESTRSQWSG